MRFMTYNIKLGLQEGLRPITEIVRRVDPDVLALQEVGCNWRMGPPGDTTARLALRTGLRHRIFIPTIVDAGALRYGHALLSRWPLRRVRRFELTRNADEPRAVVAAELVGPHTIWSLVATHLSHIRDERAVQGPEFRHLVDNIRADADDHPVVSMGDLNEMRSMPAPWLRELLDEFDDAGRHDPGPTFENPAPEQRIDYLLIDGRRWADAAVLDERDASDHRPVVAET